MLMQCDTQMSAANKETYSFVFLKKATITKENVSAMLKDCDSFNSAIVQFSLVNERVFATKE